MNKNVIVICAAMLLLAGLLYLQREPEPETPAATPDTTSAAPAMVPPKPAQPPTAAPAPVAPATPTSAPPSAPEPSAAFAATSDDIRPLLPPGCTQRNCMSGPPAPGDNTTDPAWQSRVNQWLIMRDTLRRDDSLSPADLKAQLDEARRQRFNDADMGRVENIEQMHDHE